MERYLISLYEKDGDVFTDLFSCASLFDAAVYVADLNFLCSKDSIKRKNGEPYDYTRIFGLYSNQEYQPRYITPSETRTSDLSFMILKGIFYDVVFAKEVTPGCVEATKIGDKKLDKPIIFEFLNDSSVSFFKENEIFKTIDLSVAKKILDNSSYIENNIIKNVYDVIKTELSLA